MCLFVCLFVCWFVCLFFCLFVCLFVVFACIFSLQEQESKLTKKTGVNTISGPQGLLVPFFEFYLLPSCVILLIVDPVFA